MADTATANSSVTASGSVTQQLNPDQVPPAEKPLKIVKKSSKQKLRRTVSWTADTIDNEHLNRKSSKCCCIFVKRTKFGDDEPDDEERDRDHCRGHIPKSRVRDDDQLSGPSAEQELTDPTDGPPSPAAPPSR